MQAMNGGCCYFPFVFGGHTYHHCTSDGWPEPWCSFTANYDQDQHWGTCPENQPTPPLPTTSAVGGSCGSKPAGFRIQSITHAQPDSWPWQAVVDGGPLRCSGVLIDEQWVLTAARCVHDWFPFMLVVRLGAYALTDTVQELQVDKIITHESFNSPVKFAHDIALLKLKSKATLGAGVGLVRLPDENITLVPGKTCYITGWGRLSLWGLHSGYLQEAPVPILPTEISNGSATIHNSMLLAGLAPGEVNTCTGDSGGPLVCEFDGKWYLEGVTSWGNGCTIPLYYGVYANVRYLKALGPEYDEQQLKTTSRSC